MANTCCRADKLCISMRDQRLESGCIRLLSGDCSNGSGAFEYTEDCKLFSSCSLRKYCKNCVWPAMWFSAKNFFTLQPFALQYSFSMSSAKSGFTGATGLAELHLGRGTKSLRQARRENSGVGLSGDFVQKVCVLRKARGRRVSGNLALSSLGLPTTGLGMRSGENEVLFLTLP